MAMKRQDHPHWGAFATAGDLPNVSGSPTQSSSLVEGDQAFVTGDSTYQCTNATLGGAVWELMGGGGVPISEIELGVGDYTYTQAATPVEEVVGNGSLDGSEVSTALFKASVTNVWDSTGTARVRLYDMGPAAGPPDGSPRLVYELIFTDQGGPRSTEQLLSVVSGSPGTGNGDILNSDRAYEVTIIHDVSVVGDVTYLGSATIELRGGGGGGSSGGGILVYTLVVGNEIVGDTADDCDYLDPGDGSGIQQAIDAATLLTPPGEVFVRRGIYDLGAGSIGAIQVKEGVRLLGAGRRQTIIKTRDFGSLGHAGIISNEPNVSVYDLKVYVPTPVSDITGGQYGAIVLNDVYSHLERIDVEFENGWVGIGDPYWARIDSAIVMYWHYQSLKDVRVIDAPKGSESYSDFYALYGYGYYHEVDGFSSTGGDYGFYSYLPFSGRYTNISLYDWNFIGLYVEDDEECHWDKITSRHDGVGAAAMCFYIYGSYYSNWSNLNYGTVSIPTLTPGWGIRGDGITYTNISNTVTSCPNFAGGAGNAVDISGNWSSFKNFFTNGSDAYVWGSNLSISGFRTAGGILEINGSDTSISNCTTDGGNLETYGTSVRCSCVNCTTDGGSITWTANDGVVSGNTLGAGNINVSGNNNLIIGNRLVSGVVNDTGIGNSVVNNL